MNRSIECVEWPIVYTRTVAQLMVQLSWLVNRPLEPLLMFVHSIALCSAIRYWLCVQQKDT